VLGLPRQRAHGVERELGGLRAVRDDLDEGRLLDPAPDLLLDRPDLVLENPGDVLGKARQQPLELLLEVAALRDGLGDLGLVALADRVGIVGES